MSRSFHLEDDSTNDSVISITLSGPTLLVEYSICDAPLAKLLAPLKDILLETLLEFLLELGEPTLDIDELLGLS